MTIAGPLYWRHIEPSQGTFVFDEADRLVDYARGRQFPIRGHTLVWHDLLPDWLHTDETGAGSATALGAHIMAVMSHFRGRIHAWDVINEPLSPSDGRPDGLRATAWLKLLGPEYISAAIRVARTADPSASLGINEYGLEGDTPSAVHRRRGMLGLLRHLRIHDTPVDYLGLQAHLVGTDRFSAGGLGEFVSEVRGEGVRVVVTELDVDDEVFASEIRRRDADVADVYDRFLSVLLKSQEVESVTTWGLDDASSWLQWFRPRRDGLPQRPLPFDASLSPKPAWAVLSHHLRIAPS